MRSAKLKITAVPFVKPSAIFLFLLLPMLGGAALPKGPIKVFILAGQSNMEGQAVVDLAGSDYNGGKGTLQSYMSDPDKASTLSHLKNPDGSWRVRDDVWIRYQRENESLLAGPLGLGFSVYGDQHHFGPELQFGHVVGDALDNPVLLIKAAWGGKSLYKDFRPPSSGGETGKYYKLMIAQVHEALGSIGKDFPALKGRRYNLAGFVWWQGWNDGVDPKHAVPEYEQNLVNLIHDVRHDLHSPRLPVVIGELTGPWVKADGGWAALRKAQAAATERPEFAGNVLFVPTHDFVRKPEDSPNPGHGHHEFGNAETYYLVGDALGKGALQMLGVKPKSEIKDYGLKPYLRTSQVLPHVQERVWKLVCKLPYNCQFQPWIEVEAPAAETVKFNSTNPLVLYLTPTESCHTQTGVHAYEAKNWISGEGAIYTIPPGVTVKSVKYSETGYNTSVAGSFECNDEDFNILWRKAARTAYLCMRDHFYDCPDRERVGFWGDGTPELDQCFYIFDSASHKLCKDLVLRKLEPTFYPGQHLEFLGEYGLWFYYLQTGDLASIASVYESTKAFLLDTYKFGDPNTWFDWGNDSKDTSVIETCFAYIDLGSLRKMAIATGHTADLGTIDARLESIRSSFDSRFWKGQFYQSSDVQAPDDRANAMAVNAGLADRSKWDSIYQNVLATTRNASCFFDRWVFEALCKMGRQKEAMLRMVSRYRTMIDCPVTTLWEHYDRWWASWLNAFDEGSSLNHGWNPPALLLSKEITGVRPVDPGWSTFEVMPKEAFLTSIAAVVPSVKGRVEVRIRKTSHEYAMDLDAPAGTSAIVGIPRGSFSNLDSVTANGRLVWKQSFQPVATDVSWVGETDGYLKFRVSAGRWRFVGIGALLLASPKPPPALKRREVALEKRGWEASASVSDGSFLFSGAKIPIDISAANAIDGDDWTGWRDMTQTQYPGQWFQVDMKRIQQFDRVVLDNTWALWDSPQEYALSVSSDGKHWSAPVAVGKGHLGVTTIAFPMQSARYIRVTQTGVNQTYHWSIYEFTVFRPAT